MSWLHSRDDAAGDGGAGGDPWGVVSTAMRRVWMACVLLLAVGEMPPARAQQSSDEPAYKLRAQRFLAGRTAANGASGAAALAAARAQHLQMVQEQGTGNSPTANHRMAATGLGRPRATGLGAAWTPVGPAQVATASFGAVTGRITSIAIDPADATGNTVYLGTTGGGVWKSTNAAGPAANVSFVPLTDTLPVFSPNSSAAVVPSLSIGAVSVGQYAGADVLLAGTGDPNDASDSYYGEGILRSVDGGATWTLAQQSNDGTNGFHSFVGLGVAGFAWSTTTPGLVIAAFSQAAEGVLVNAPNGTYSVMGLYYSTDGGAAWKMATLKDGTQLVQQPVSGGAPGNAATAVVWNPARQRFYAAVRFHGYYESADGATWTRLPSQPGTRLTQSACPTNFGSQGNANCPIFRGVLAVQATTGDTFALTADIDNQDQGLWQDACGLSFGSCSTNEIAFGTKLNSAPLEVGSGSTKILQADYDLALEAVASGGDTLLFAGTVDLYRCSLATGCVLRNTTNAENGCAAPAMVAPAQHAIVALANAGAAGSPLLYIGNDGGLWRSTDGVDQQQTPCSPDDKTHFNNLNDALGSLAEVVSFAQDTDDPDTLLAGLGANGTAATSAARTGALSWPQLSGGEGGSVAIDPANPLNWYASIAAGVNLRYCGKGGACTAADFAGAPTIGLAQVANDDALIDEPILLDPQLTTSVLIGTCRVWRGPAASASTWPGTNEVSTQLGTALAGVCSGTNANVRSLAAAGPASGAPAPQDAGSTVLYAGMAGALDGGSSYGGHLFVDSAAGTANSNTAWTDAAQSAVTNDAFNAGVFNPGRFDISSVTADPHDAGGMTVYATVMGFASTGISAPHVYRSTNGGASWTNISSNLPNAPANAVLVDPNDANTVYVAMDSGVYATSAVTTCVSSNCWGVMGTSLPNAPVIGLQASAAMATGDGRSGELRAATYGRGIWEIPLLTAHGPAVPAITLNPGSLTFATQQVGTASAPQTVSVTNSGTVALIIAQITTSGDFSETDNCVGAIGGIAPNASCTMNVVFLPSATGARTGSLIVYGNVAGGQGSAQLSGTGAPPAAVMLNPVSVTFPATNVGATSAAQNITISNTGGVTATLQTPQISGDFAITANTCGATLAPNTGCTVSIAFTPAASGSRNGAFSITGSAGTQTASLTGVGQAQPTDTIAPLSLTFAAQQLNTASTTQTVTLTNSGDVPLILIATQISGDFTVVNGCGVSLPGHSTCSIQVAFVPKALGTRTGTLIVSDQLRSQTVSLIGAGIAPPGASLAPVSPLSFGTEPVGQTSGVQTVTLTNSGGVTLAISNISVTGDFAIVGNACGSNLAPGVACTMEVAFSPSAGGARIGTLTVADNAASSPQLLTLTGAGIDFSLTATGPTTATVSAGTNAVYPLLLTSAASVPGTVTFTCGPLPPHAICTITPSNPALGGTTAITVTVATSVLGAKLDDPFGKQMVWFALLLPLGLAGLRTRARQMRRLGAASTLCATVLVCGALAGCGVSRIIPATTLGGGGTATPTPTGTYNLTVAATSSGLTRSVGLTLIVQ